MARFRALPLRPSTQTYWTDNRADFPQLAATAFRLLAIRAGIAGVEVQGAPRNSSPTAVGGVRGKCRVVSGPIGPVRGSRDLAITGCRAFHRNFLHGRTPIPRFIRRFVLVVGLWY